MTAYLDASAILPILIDEPASAAVDRFIVEDAESLVISDFAAAEVASALSRLVRTGAIDRSDAEARLGDSTYGGWPRPRASICRRSTCARRTCSYVGST